MFSNVELLRAVDSDIAERVALYHTDPGSKTNELASKAIARKRMRFKTFAGMMSIHVIVPNSPNMSDKLALVLSFGKIKVFLRDDPFLKFGENTKKGRLPIQNWGMVAQ